MVDNGLADVGRTGDERRKAYHSILGVNGAWDLLCLRRVDGDSRSGFILARLNCYMDVMLRRTAVALPIFYHTPWKSYWLSFILLCKAFPLDLALQLCIEIAKAFRSVEHRYTL